MVPGASATAILEVLTGTVQDASVTVAQEQEQEAGASQGVTETAILEEQEQDDSGEESGSWESGSESSDSEWSSDECAEWERVKQEIIAELRQVNKGDRLQWLAVWYFEYRKQDGCLQVWRDYGVEATAEAQAAEEEATEWATNVVQEIRGILYSWQEQEAWWAAQAQVEAQAQAQAQA
jgi:hypothetical protein